METAQAAAPRVRYQSRPGREVLVAADLAELRGPVSGTVELPLWLFWYPDRTFDLDEPGMLPWMYQVVLREASSCGDLSSYLNGAMLVTLWPDLFLPGGVRQAWEDRHPVLRAMAASAEAEAGAVAVTPEAVTAAPAA
ncbi:MAG TPA: hypothetical protein VGL63_02520 [Streptosporangiaceae bacterium]|jgi:hypothetical protein